MKPKTNKIIRLAADIGGTFTDVAAFDEKKGRLYLGKTLSTPHRLVAGILDGVHKTGIAIDQAQLFLHGSTIAINTMLERSGAKTALITTRGFRDIYEIGRINRPDSFNLHHRKHQPLVERDLRFELTERLLANGTIHLPLNQPELDALINELAKLDIEAVAILFLHAYRNPKHEVMVRNQIRKKLPHLFVSISSDLSQEYREFERTSTVVANAYIGPRIDRYLGEIETELKTEKFSGQFHVVQSTGGLYSLKEARKDCVRMMESGPASGVIGTQVLCEALNIPNAIAFDMGGTTAKAGVVRAGEALVANSVMIGGYLTGLPLLTPMIDIHEVGTGGGSMATLSATGALRVGPQSAGAMPGPVCYGLGGTQPTVTDANLLLGRLNPDHFLGGEMQLYSKASQTAMLNKIAKPLGLDVTKAAYGILQIAAASMSHAVKGVTTDRGLDPGAFPYLFAYGGAGPLHASMVARELRIPHVIIPRAPGHFSAFGMLLANFRKDLVRSMFITLGDVQVQQLNAWFEDLESTGFKAQKDSGLPIQRVVVQRYLDMRYVGQEHAVTVEIPFSAFKQKNMNLVKQSFDQAHEERYGRGSPHEMAEIVSIRSAISGVMKKPTLEKIQSGISKPLNSSSTGRRKAYFGIHDWCDTPVFAREHLLAGNVIQGPALIEEHASTTVVQPGDRVKVDVFGNLHLSIDQRKK